MSGLRLELVRGLEAVGGERTGFCALRLEAEPRDLWLESEATA